VAGATAAERYRIRAAVVPADSPALYRIHETAILTLARNAYTAAEVESWAIGLSPDHYTSCVAEKGEIFFVAEDAAGIAGFSAHKADTLLGLYVAPDHAGQGLGRALLRHAEAAMIAAGAAIIHVEAALSALPFYEQAGYAIQQRRQVQSRGGLWMEVADMTKITHLRPAPE
jgi:putative acetyltransferase